MAHSEEMKLLDKLVSGNVIALVRCADDRVTDALRRDGAECLWGWLLARAEKVYEIANEGAGWQFSPSNRLTEAAFAINAHVLGIADVVVILAHSGCAKYQMDDEAARADARSAAAELRRRLRKPVVLLWHSNPEDAALSTFEVDNS